MVEQNALLEAMIPAGLSLDEEETLRARVGLGDVAPRANFTGGYAEAPEQAAKRVTKKAAAPKASRGLKDVIITMTVAQKAEFAELVAWHRREDESTADVVLRCLWHRAAFGVGT